MGLAAGDVSDRGRRRPRRTHHRDRPRQRDGRAADRRGIDRHRPAGLECGHRRGRRPAGRRPGHEPDRLEHAGGAERRGRDGRSQPRKRDPLALSEGPAHRPGRGRPARCQRCRPDRLPLEADRGPGPVGVRAGHPRLRGGRPPIGSGAADRLQRRGRCPWQPVGEQPCFTPTARAPGRDIEAAAESSGTRSPDDDGPEREASATDARYAPLDEGHRPRRRDRDAALPADDRHEQAPAADLRPADDLLPDRDPRRDGHPRGDGHRAARASATSWSCSRTAPTSGST